MIRFCWCEKVFLSRYNLLSCCRTPLHKRIVTGDKITATELELETYALSWSFSRVSYRSLPQFYVFHKVYLHTSTYPCIHDKIEAASTICLRLAGLCSMLVAIEPAIKPRSTTLEVRVLSGRNRGPPVTST